MLIISTGKSKRVRAFDFHVADVGRA